MKQNHSSLVLLLIFCILTSYLLVVHSEVRVDRAPLAKKYDDILRASLIRKAQMAYDAPKMRYNRPQNKQRFENGGNSDDTRLNQYLLYSQLVKQLEPTKGRFMVNRKCDVDDYKISCCVGPMNIELLNHELMKLTLCTSGAIDIIHKSAYFKMIVNDYTVYEKDVSMSDMRIPICVPVLDQLQVNLCLSFSDIRVNFEKQCFSAMASATLEIPYMPEVVFLTVPFGYRMEECSSELTIDHPTKPL